MYLVPYIPYLIWVNPGIKQRGGGVTKTRKDTTSSLPSIQIPFAVKPLPFSPREKRVKLKSLLWDVILPLKGRLCYICVLSDNTSLIIQLLLHVDVCGKSVIGASNGPCGAGNRFSTVSKRENL